MNDFILVPSCDNREKALVFWMHWGGESTSAHPAEEARATGRQKESWDLAMHKADSVTREFQYANPGELYLQTNLSAAVPWSNLSIFQINKIKYA